MSRSPQPSDSCVGPNNWLAVSDEELSWATWATQRAHIKPHPDVDDIYICIGADWVAEYKDWYPESRVVPEHRIEDLVKYLVACDETVFVHTDIVKEVSLETFRGDDEDAE